MHSKALLKTCIQLVSASSSLHAKNIKSLSFNIHCYNESNLYFQFFLSNRACYLLLWNIRLGFEHAGLDFWLNSIACHAPKAPILVVGTHCDKVST